VTPERASEGELAQAVADHILGHEDRHVTAAIVHGDGHSEPFFVERDTYLS
jgi:hypothetical protein